MLVHTQLEDLLDLKIILIQTLILILNLIIKMFTHERMAN